MKGAGAGAASPGDYVYFKSVVPLHKISVSSSAPRLHSSHLASLFPSHPGFMGMGTRPQAVPFGTEFYRGNGFVVASYMGSSEFGLDLKRIPGEELSVVGDLQELAGWCNLVRCY